MSCSICAAGTDGPTGAETGISGKITGLVVKSVPVYAAGEAGAIVNSAFNCSV